MRVLFLSLLLATPVLAGEPDSAKAREAYFDALGFGEGFSDEDMALVKALAEGDEMTGLAALLLMADELAELDVQPEPDTADVRLKLERTDTLLQQHSTEVVTLLAYEQHAARTPPGSPPPPPKLKPLRLKPLPSADAPASDAGVQRLTLTEKPTRTGLQPLTVKEKGPPTFDTPPDRSAGPVLRPLADPSQRLTRLLSLRDKAYARIDTPAPALPPAVDVRFNAAALSARRPEGPITAVAQPTPQHSMPERHNTQVQVEATVKTAPEDRTWAQWAYQLVFGE